MDSLTINTDVFLQPWLSLSDMRENTFAQEIYKEVSEKHILFGVKVKEIAKKCDTDDVLFLLLDGTHRVAVVHLTWKNGQESDPHWPKTIVYPNMAEWKEKRMIPDYLDYVDEIDIFTVEKAHKRFGSEISLYGSCTRSIKLGDYIIMQDDQRGLFRVKGIECLSYMEKEKNHLNPWIIIETDSFRAENMIEKKFIIARNESK